MENGKRKMENEKTLRLQFPFSVFRFPFSVFFVFICGQKISSALFAPFIVNKIYGKKYQRFV